MEAGETSPRDDIPLVCSPVPMNYLPYTIVHTSSRDEEMEREWIEENGMMDAEGGNEVCWITEKDHSYPQSLVVRLDEDSFVGSIEVETHQIFVPSSMSIAFGIRDTRFTGDKSHNASYTTKLQFSFVDRKEFKKRRYLFFNDPALYVRFTLHGFLTGDDNPGRQAGVVSIVIRSIGQGSSLHNPHYDLVNMLDWSSWRTGPDDLVRKRKSPAMPTNQAVQKAPAVLYESDTDDEEVIFTKDMLKRLTAKAKELQSNRPASALSDSGVSSTSTVTESSTVAAAPTTPVPSDQLTPRTRERVLREIESFGEQLGLNFGKSKRPKRYYFGRRLAELNNATRMLEARREQAIWKEEYGLAHEIDVVVNKLKAREAPLKELLIERMDALEKNQLLEAQRLKDRFDFNLSDALDFSGLEQYMTEKELKRLQADINRHQEGADD